MFPRQAAGQDAIARADRQVGGAQSSRMSVHADKSGSLFRRPGRDLIAISRGEAHNPFDVLDTDTWRRGVSRAQEGRVLSCVWDPKLRSLCGGIDGCTSASTMLAFC